ncbi:MAG: putative parvulin-type peptidyl-prolyl cis-trans isomerase [Alphaproteobacteria bacterium MarineAlpha2_Bin1]|nr:MAG: putative parvulin-type peptidyl-prolyl cis-trans isomerase [Alphaproteobacteria bacterium MarineAlpha2_Bin1]|tara:strand:- start:1403 stop:2257 length:855 start_codon:yes stop_codon:yes gene_type:complete
MPLTSIANSCKYLRKFTLYYSLIVCILCYFSSESFSNEKVIAIVGEEEIKITEVNVLIKNLSGQVLFLPKEQLRKMVLKQIINNKLIANLAKSNDLDKSSEFQILKSISEERMLHDIYIREEINKRHNKQLLKQKYREYINEFTDKVEIRVKHILLSSKEDAEKILKYLDNGNNFSDLAKKYSIGPSANLGGDLGYFSKDIMVREFSEVAFSLKIDEISKPVETKFGWHVIKLLDRRQIDPPKFEQVQEKLIENLKKEIHQEIILLGKKKYKVIIIDKDNFTYE